MKINQSVVSSRDLLTGPRERMTLESGSFRQLVKDQQQRLSANQLERLFGEIEKQGERMVQHRTVEELRSYKELVRKFVKEAVEHGVGLQEQQSFPFGGKERRFKILKELDSHLLGLTNEVINQQQSTIDILSRMGEIKGLLLNLYL